MNILSMLPWLITAVGIYFLIRLRFFFIIHPRKTFKSLFRGRRSDFTSLALALAGTLGVGNIVGVAVGIAVGGAGAVFWLIISAVFSSVIKYAEVALATDSGESLGFIGTVRRSFGRCASLIFSLICLALAFIMGGALQCSAIAEGAETGLGIGRAFFLFPILLFVAFVALGGGEKIEKCVSVIIPLTTLVYFFICISVILPRLARLPQVMADIMRGAFSIKGSFGGVLGFLTSVPIKEGYARGILSNEAGAGTSAFAHTRAMDRTPHAAGVFGILEVLFDTVILCSLTAFTILLGGADTSADSGIGIIGSVLRPALGGWSLTVLFICIFFFAISTVFCWYYYGEVCWGYIFKGRCRPIYFLMFLLSCALGVFYAEERLIFITDILLFTLSLITLSTLIKNRNRVKELRLREREKSLSSAHSGRSAHS